MMKNLKKSDIITVILCLCAIIPGAVVYDRLPDRMVTNWDMASRATDTAPKAFAVFGIPLIFSVLTLIGCIYLRKLEKKRSIGKGIPVLCVVFPTVLYLCQGLMLFSALGKVKDIRYITCFFVSAVIIILGNYLPKIRKNWVVGIRTPHIMSSDEIWDKTHRFGGFVLMICGVIGIIAAMLGIFTVAFIVLVGSVLVPVVYGEILYYSAKKQK